MQLGQVWWRRRCARERNFTIFHSRHILRAIKAWNFLCQFDFTRRWRHSKVVSDLFLVSGSKQAKKIQKNWKFQKTKIVKVWNWNLEMAPNNNVPTIQLTEVEIPKHVVSEIDDTQKTWNVDMDRVVIRKFRWEFKAAWSKKQKMKIPRNLLNQIASSLSFFFFSIDRVQIFKLNNRQNDHKRSTTNDKK